MAVSGTPGDDGVPEDDDFVVEDISTGVFASGFGHLSDGRRFAFHVDREANRGILAVEVFRPRRSGAVPLPEDVIATARRSLADVDTDDPRSLAAAVRDAIATAEPVARNER